MGPNGSGKTNILDAISFIFTGKLAKNADGKQARKQETYIFGEHGVRADNASVELHFSKGGLKAQAFRQIGKTPKRWLKWDGADEGKPVTKGAEIDRLMEEILDCDKDAMDLAVFLTQGGVGKFLFLTEAKREEQFAAMCLIDHLDTVAEIAGQESIRVGRMVTDLAPMKDEATRNRQEQLDALEVAETSLKGRRDVTLIIGQKTELIALQTALSSARTSSEAAAAAKSAQPVLDEALSAEALQTALNETGAALQAADDLQKGVDRARATIQSKKTKTARLVTVEAELAKLPGLEQEREEIGKRLLTLEGQEADLARRSAEGHELIIAAETSKAQAATVVRVLGALTWAETGAKDAGVEYEAQRQVTYPTEEAADTLVKEAEEITTSVRLVPLILQMADAGDCGETACVLCGSTDWKGLPGPEEVATMRVDLATKNAKIQTLKAEAAALRKLREAGLAALQRQEILLQSAEDRLKACREEAKTLVYPTGPAANVEEIRAKQAELVRTIAEVRSGLGMARERQSALSAALAVARGLRDEKTALVAELATLPDDATLEKEAADVADPRELREKSESFTRRIRILQEHQDENRRLRDRVQATVDALALSEQKLHSHKAITGDSSETPAEDLANLQTQQREYQQCQGAVENAKSTFRKAEQRLREVEERMDAQLHIRDVIGQLDTLRGHFSRTGIPRHYLSRIFDTLVGITQEQLTLWEEDFQVQRDPETLFNFQFFRSHDPDTIMDQSQLSGGQKVRLALAFVMAVQEVMFPTLGFLCVDEPSTHLDVPGKEGLVRIFRKIAERNSLSDAQVIVVDHAPELLAGFTNSYELKKFGE